MPSAAAPEIVWLPGHANGAIGEFAAERGPADPMPSVCGESATTVAALPRSSGAKRDPWVAVVVVLGLLTLAQASFVVLWASRVSPVAPRAGTFIVETLPAGLEVQLDGKVVGATPLTVAVQAGRRTLRLHFGDRERLVTTQVAPGETVRHRFEFLPAPPPAVAPATAPLVVKSTGAAAPARPIPPGSLSGWVRVEVPASLRIFEAGQLIGTTDVDRLMLPVGTHELDFRSDELGFSARQTVVVRAGSTTTIQVGLPRAPLSINAKPWAEAWVDGERVGDTPIGNLARPIGRHEVVLRHPELGERRESVLVTLDRPGRVSVDLTQNK